MYRRFAKRSLDIVLFWPIGLVDIFPVMLIVAILIRLQLGSPVLFRQVRPGRDTKPFTILKFRSIGCAQAKRRNSLTWEQKVEFNGWYVDHVSFWLAFRIILMTVWRLIRLSGSAMEGTSSMPNFLGTGRQDEPPAMPPA